MDGSEIMDLADNNDTCTCTTSIVETKDTRWVGDEN